MKHTDKNNNRPYIKAGLFFSFVFAAFVLFAIASATFNPSGFGDGNGPHVFGAGSGNGSGDGHGNGSQSGNLSDLAQGAFKGENPDAENTDNTRGKGDGKGKGEGKGDGQGAPPPAPEADSDDGDAAHEQKAGNQQSAVNTVVKKNLPVARLYLAPEKDDKDKKPVKKVKPRKVEKTFRKSAGKIKLSDTEGGGGSRKFSASSGGRSVFRIQKNKNILFIVDISGSMGIAASEGQTRLSILQFQLKRTIREQHRQRSKGKYSIIAFSTNCYYFPDDAKTGQYKFSDASSVAKTERWVDSFDQLERGSTNLFTAMQDGLDRIDKQGLEIDTIFILTDGEPTDVHDSKQYLKLLKEGLPKSVSINTISIGTTSQLLKDISKEYKGVYDEYK